MDWLRSLPEIRKIKLDLARLDARRGMPVLPPVGATSRAIAGVERKLGRRLPPSYRAFLAEHDGWPQFFAGASLLGARHLARGTYVDLGRLMLGAFDERTDRSDDASVGSTASLLPFGIDAQAETIFAFDSSVEIEDELEVVILVNDVGERLPSFAAFVAFVREALLAELDDRRRAAPRLDRYGRPMPNGAPALREPASATHAA